eukprot:scaffold145_cov195-Alexandrium_tamarense.AAC.41
MSSATSTTEEPKSQAEIISTYRQMTSDMQGMIQQLTKFEIELNEHRRVPRWWIRGWRGCLVIFNCSLGNNTHRVTVSYPSRPPFQPNHRLVEETLTPLDPDRRAFRLVGGVLVRCSFRGRCGRCANCLTFLMVERTVREVLPTVKDVRTNLEELVKSVKERLDVKQKETAAWKAKYNIKTQEEVDAGMRLQAPHGEEFQMVRVVDRILALPTYDQTWN